MAAVLLDLPIAALGLAIGSFLTVVVDRVPLALSVSRPRSRCPSCEESIRASDNIPLVSYVWRGGRCHACAMRIPWVYPLIELTTAVLFVAVALRSPSPWLVPAFCTLAASLIALSTIDVAHFRLPSRIIHVSAALGIPLLVVASAGAHRWSALISSVISACIWFVILFAIFLLAPKGIGFGDVRLAALCGLYVGWLGYRIAIAGLLVSFVIGGAVGAILLITGQVKRQSRIPFGPFLAAGTMTSALFGPSLVHLWFG